MESQACRGILEVLAGIQGLKPATIPIPPMHTVHLSPFPVFPPLKCLWDIKNIANERFRGGAGWVTSTLVRFAESALPQKGYYEPQKNGERDSIKQMNHLNFPG